jgi:hypothetical protein
MGWIGRRPYSISGILGYTKTTMMNVQSDDDPNTTATIAMTIQPLFQDFQKKGLTLIGKLGHYFVKAAACLVSQMYKTYLQDQDCHGSDKFDRLFKNTANFTKRILNQTRAWGAKRHRCSKEVGGRTKEILCMYAVK